MAAAGSACASSTKRRLQVPPPSSDQLMAMSPKLTLLAQRRTSGSRGLTAIEFSTIGRRIVLEMRMSSPALMPGGTRGPRQTWPASWACCSRLSLASNSASRGSSPSGVVRSGDGHDEHGARRTGAPRATRTREPRLLGIACASGVDMDVQDPRMDVAGCVAPRELDRVDEDSAREALCARQDAP